MSAYRNIDYDVFNKNLNLSREAQLAGIPFGSYKESWVATPDAGRRNTELRIQFKNNFYEIPYIATPGTKHVGEVYIKPLRATPVNANTIVINEVRNDTSRTNVDWVELKNASTRTIEPQELGIEHRNGFGGS